MLQEDDEWHIMSPCDGDGLPNAEADAWAQAIYLPSSSGTCSRNNIVHASDATPSSVRLEYLS